MQEKKTRKKPPARGRPSSGRPRKLTHAAIVDAAEALVREAGTAALTLRSLSARLGVQAPTLYTYFGHLDEIEAAVVERVVGGIPMPDLERPQPLDQQVADLFVALRNLQQHSPKAMAGAPGSVAWKWTVRASNQLLGVHEAMGADPERALLVYRVLSGLALHSAVTGHVQATAEQVAEHRRMVERMPPADTAFVRRLYGNAPAVALPADAGLRAVLLQTIHALLPAAAKLDAARIKALRRN